MPKLEAKAVQKELDQGVLWPFYWIYGSERFKSRELLGKIKKAVLGEQPQSGMGLSWNEESFDGSEVSAERVLDAAQSLALGGGVRLIVVREAHSLKNPDLLVELMGPSCPRSELTSVCVFLSKDLDGRKKFSKSVSEKAAVVACEEVPEKEREAWIQYLAKRQGIEVSPALNLRLCALDPWSLDGVDQELQKFSISNLDPEVVLEGGALGQGGDFFLEGFFSRDLKKTLPQLIHFAERSEETLPLIGLLGWNVRQLALYLSDREVGTRHSKLNSFLVDRFKRWALKWNLAELTVLQRDLVELDQMLKLSPLMHLGLWNQLVTRFCRE